ncbi:hypothetical protein C2E23DRAFT_855733 [Lenzites betulinus]|nr:hypothetical protein C2E23DRAFT_855733 [Lenzites betulinus]
MSRCPPQLLTRGSTASAESTPLDTPFEYLPLRHGSHRKPDAQDGVRVRTPSNGSSAFSRSRIRAVNVEDHVYNEAPGEHERPTPESYFALPARQADLPPAPALGRRGTTKDLIGRFESMERSASPSRGPSPSPVIWGRGSANDTTDVDAERERELERVRIRAKGRSPIRQSFRNLLSVFKKTKPGAAAEVKAPARALPGTRYKAESPSPTPAQAPTFPKPSLTLQIPTHAHPGQRTLMPDLAQTDPRNCVSPVSAHTGKQGPLLHLTRVASSSPSSPAPEMPPVWLACAAQLHTTHILISWQTAGGNPASRLVPFAACADVRSLALGELSDDERALLPATGGRGELKVFELQFEGRARERFAAEGVAERAGWVSAIWDAVLLAQENRVLSPAAESVYASSIMSGIEAPDPHPLRPVVREKSDDVYLPTPCRVSQISTVSAERALPALPPINDTPTERPTLPRLNLRDLPPIAARAPSLPGGLSPLPAPPATPTSVRGAFLSLPDSPARTQSPSIRNLDRRSVVKQRLAQIESARPGSNTSSPVSPSTRRWELRDGGPMARGESSTAGSILNSYMRAETVIRGERSETGSVRSTGSGRLTTAPPTPMGSPPPRNSRFSQRDAVVQGPERADGSGLLALPRREDGLFSPGSRYSDDGGAGVENEPAGAASQIRTALQALAVPLPQSTESIAPPVISYQNIGRDRKGEPTLEKICEGVDALRGRSATDSTNLVNVRTKVDEVLSEVRRLRSLEEEDAPRAAVTAKLDEVQMDIKGDLTRLQGTLEGIRNTAGVAGQQSVHPDIGELHEKLDGLLRLCQSQGGQQGEGGNPGAHIAINELAEVLVLLKDAEEQRVTQMEQQTDSIRYLNELNSWLEAFVKHGTSQIEGVAAGVQQLCQELGPVQGSQVVGADGETPAQGNLLSDIRRLLVQHQEREENAVTLNSSVNGLVAAVQEDMRRNAEARNLLTTESVVGMIDRQRQDQERMLRTLATGLELSNDIRGERLRFVEAMKEATAINVQIHVEEFKKELTREVMLMTQEVTRLQRERQGLEQQISDLFAFYAKQKQAGKVIDGGRMPLQAPPIQIGQQGLAPVMPGSIMPSQSAMYRRPLPSPAPSPTRSRDPASAAVGRTDNAKDCSPSRSSRSATKVMSALRLVTSVARRAPRNFALGRRGYAEAADKISLSLVLPHQAIFTSAEVVQVNVAAASGDMGILANHAPTIEALRPGVVEVIEAGSQSKKWFVSGGFATVHPNNKLTINAVEAAPLEAFSAEAVRANLQEALKVVAGNGAEEDKVEARIEADVYEALQHALSK